MEEARNQLTNDGIVFDSGYDIREGTFEWSLKGNRR